MTRKEVARRLGKSIATVRRIEGTLLHPVKDGNGVNRFDPDEVDSLVAELRQGRLALSSEFPPPFADGEREADTDSECLDCAAYVHEIEKLRTTIAERERAHRQAMERVETARDRETAAYKREAQELVDQVDDLMLVLGVGVVAPAGRGSR